MFGDNTTLQAGPTITIMTLAVWCMLNLHEVFDCLELMFGLLFVPRSHHTHLSHVGGTSNYVIGSLTCRRIIWIYAICILRLSIAVWLFYQGSTWIIYTTDV